MRLRQQPLQPAVPRLELAGPLGSLSAIPPNLAFQRKYVVSLMPWPRVHHLASGPVSRCGAEVCMGPFTWPETMLRGSDTVAASRPTIGLGATADRGDVEALWSTPGHGAHLARMDAGLRRA